MDIEDLSKTQLLLLTILVNFVTSIATGVLTVSLLDDSAPTVTQTVNRIVERTIETVANDAPITVPVTVPGIVTEKPSGPTEEQLLTSAIASADARMVRIERNKVLLGWGVYLPATRAVATLVNPDLVREVVIVFPDGTSAEASRAKAGAVVTIYGFSDTATLPDAPTPRLIGYENLAAGQTTVALTSNRSAVTGIISKVDTSGIATSLTGVPAGSAAVNLSGDIIGISAGGGVFVSADNISALLAATSTPTSQ
jgi:hypothetical protein